MRDSKGISMISLIVTIIVTILLATLAIGTGTRYIRESKKRDREVFVSVMSSAVAKRHEDTGLNSLAYPYLGYYINDSTIFETVFAPKVSDEVKYEEGIWYVLDTTTARELGVKDPEKYIETIDTGYTEDVKLVLANYATGNVYLIDATSADIGNLDNVITGPVIGHEHRYVDEANYPNCTEPLKCADCGFIKKEALGHEYGEGMTSKPAEGDEENAHYSKTCSRCGMQGGYEAHKFEYVRYKKDNLWYHRAYCTECLYDKMFGVSTEERCTEVITVSDVESESEKNHINSCRVCKKIIVDEPHEVKYRRISESMHEKYCANPLCLYVITREIHVDSGSDSKCDLCNSEIISYSYPQLIVVEMSNASPISEDKKYVAKYGDNIAMKIVSDKALKKDTLKITIGGQIVPQDSITTTDNKTWNVLFYLNPVVSISDGNLQFKIECESTSGVSIPSAVTSTTDGKRILFDSAAPQVQYIPKKDRVDENL